MKRIMFVVLMLVLICFGQINDGDTLYFGEDYKLVYEQIHRWNIGDFIGVYLQLYDEYKKECYADSTLIGGEVFAHWETGIIDTLVPPTKPFENLLGSKGIVHFFIHRKPTFQGFVEFLRGKSKE